MDTNWGGTRKYDQARVPRAASRSGPGGPGDELERLRARLAQQDAELATLCAATGDRSAVAASCPGRVVEDELVLEVRRWESDLGRLEQCSHPGVEHQIEDLRRRIAFRREEIRGTWSPERQRRRLELRAAEAQKDVEKAEAAATAAQRVLEEAQAAVAQAAARVEAKRQLAADRCAELARLKTEHAVDSDMVGGGDRDGPEPPSTGADADPEHLLRLLLASPQGVALLAARAGAAQDSISATGRGHDGRERSPRRAGGGDARGGQ